MFAPAAAYRFAEPDFPVGVTCRPLAAGRICAARGNFDELTGDRAAPASVPHAASGLTISPTKTTKMGKTPMAGRCKNATTLDEFRISAR
jgi:hypothetical protein